LVIVVTETHKTSALGGPYDLVILGAGPAGLAAAERAARLGAKVALIERDRLGGNSLNAGSIPSKSLIRSAILNSEIHAARDSSSALAPEPTLDFSAVMARMRRIRARIGEYHSIDRLHRDGIHLYFGTARFDAPDSLRVGELRLPFIKALIATGARPSDAGIAGLDTVGFLTSDTIVNLAVLPRSLTVIGGGPLGCELAQAFCRLGAEVTIVQNEAKFLPREERDAAELLSRCLAHDGVDIRLNTTVVSARLESGNKILDTRSDGTMSRLSTDEILLSIGRTPNIDDIGLANAKVECDHAQGIKVDDFFGTTNPRIYAAGDVCMAHKFANVAQASARMAVDNLMGVKIQARRHEMVIPWCTYCDPEIAHVGLQVWEARAKSIPVKSYTVMMQDVDRAITDDQGHGFVKIHVRNGSDQIIGATIVASRASEMINELCVAMRCNMGLLALADVLHTYPSQCDAIRAAAAAFVRDNEFQSPDNGVEVKP
jgi:pyruvate/2-oxoglutarate dehydrogenase complex dihydrolipoamide dehydrogenase (E3) component